MLFVAAATLSALLIDSMLSDRIKEHLHAEKELTASAYRSVIGGYKAQADILYYNRLSVPDVIGLFRHARSASEAERADIRRRLYALLLPVYENISLYHLKQMHFHLENSDSFLRFHRPEKFGDSLIGVRDTVAYVNRTHEPVTGFEEGRIFNGYRFVYPLFDGSDYLGSVEISISMQTILESILKDIDADVDFIIRAQTVTSKVFKDEQQNYAPSELFGSYMHEKALNALQNPVTRTLIREHIRRHGPLDAALARGDAFNFFESDGKTAHIVTFLPVVNAVSQKTVAYIILDRRHEDIDFMVNQSGFITLTVVSLLALLFFLLYRGSVQRHAIETDRQQLQSLLDQQKNIVILTDGKRLLFANRFFFKSLNFSSLKQFQDAHDCICDLFIRDDRLFHLGKVPAGKNWLAALTETPATKRIVKMLDNEGTPRIYTVAANTAGKNRYIVTFTDISLTISNQTKLEQRAARDKLTDAYNREFLDANFHRIVQSAKVQQKRLGVIMIDLDYFKRVNDTYGHNRGDEVLKSIVGIIRQTIRQEDSVIRWGGEEFVLLMMIDSADNVSAIAEGIRARIDRATLEEVGHITASFGLTVHHEGESMKETLARADRALYRAKASGRNTVITDKS